MFDSTRELNCLSKFHLFTDNRHALFGNPSRLGCLLIERAYLFINLFDFCMVFLGRLSVVQRVLLGLVLSVSSNIEAVRPPFAGRRRAAQGRRIIKNSGRRIIKNSGRRIIINIRHNYMHDVTRWKSGGVRRNKEE